MQQKYTRKPGDKKVSSRRTIPAPAASDVTDGDSESSSSVAETVESPTAEAAVAEETGTESPGESETTEG